MEKQNSFAAVDAQLQEQMRRLTIPGAALVIVEGDQIVHLRGFGKMRPGGAAPTPQTPFYIASLTKSFTALAVMQLVEAAKIALDAPVQCYLPWFTLADPHSASQMTVRHLLNQSSGFSTWSGWTPLDGIEEGPGADARRARAFATMQPEHPVGTAFAYSNLNYLLLGLLIEAVSGERYADFVQSHILAPLGMHHTYFDENTAKQDGLAVGYRYWFWQPFPAPNLHEPLTALPGGGLIACVEDLGRYLIAQLNGGRCGGQPGDGQILSPAGFAEMHRPAMPMEIMGWKAHYGMGWYHETAGQTEIVWHGGTMPNFASYMALLPQQKRAMALLLNVDHFLMNPVITEIGGSLAASLAGQKPAAGPFGFRISGLAPWITRALLLIPLLQILDVLWTLRRARRWQQNRQRPIRRRLFGQHLLLPLLLNLGFAAVPIYLQAKERLGFLLNYFPDFAWVTVIGGAFAGAWALVRAAMLLLCWQKGETMPPINDRCCSK